MEKKVAVVLAGCGYLDGAEITESVSSLIALSEEGAQVKIFAPKVDLSVFDHNTNEAMDTKRDVFAESARISRGNLHDIETLNEADFDAIVFPGGFGVAKNLSSFVEKGSKASVNKKLAGVIEDFHEASKPIAVFCIAPVLCALVLGKHGVALTIGNDPETAKEIEKTGAEHIDCEPGDYVTDRANKVLSSPAYMYESPPHIVFKGIKAALRELMEMA